MKNKKIKYAIQFSIIITLIITSIFIYARFNYTDAIEFKREYEALNTEVDEHGNNIHIWLNIPRINRVKILSFDELINFLESGTGIIYFGKPACPWSRMLIPGVLEFSREKRVNIYYYNIEEDLNTNNENYQKIVAFLYDYLPTDTITQNETDENFNENLKRIILPHLFFLRNGVIKADQLFFEHEYLENNEKEKIKDLLKSMLQKAK